MALGQILIDMTELVNRLDAQFAVLERIAATQSWTLDRIKKLEEMTMAKADELQKAVDDLTRQFRDATDEVARDIAALRELIRNGLSGGLTAEEANALQADLQTRLGAAVDRLVEIGKDPVPPIPE